MNKEEKISKIMKLVTKRSSVDEDKLDTFKEVLESLNDNVLNKFVAGIVFAEKPFKSEKQRRFLHANHPEIAKRWEKDYENEEGPSFTLDDVLESGMEILGDYGAYEANLRGSETIGAGVESLKELVEYYLSKLGLTDTDAEYYKKRHEAYQAIWDENSRLNKELLGHADRDEKRDQEILNQRYNAMILAAMNAPQEDEETFNEAVKNILQSYDDV